MKKRDVRARDGIKIPERVRYSPVPTKLKGGNKKSGDDNLFLLLWIKLQDIVVIIYGVSTIKYNHHSVKVYLRYNVCFLFTFV